MRVQVEKDYLKIHINDLLSELEDDDLLKLIDTISCNETVIKNVADQILDGWTEMGSHGARMSNGRSHTALEQARHRIAIESGDIAKTTIEELKKALIRIENLYLQYRTWAWSQYHNDPGSHEPPKINYNVDYSQYEVIKREAKNVQPDDTIKI